jgi:DNA primase
MDSESEATRAPGYRGVSYVRPIDAAKEAVPVIDLADRLYGPGGLRRVGKEWVGRCPLPDHTDRSPSFAVNPEKNLWFCHGCLHGGDAVALARLMWGYDERDAHVAAANLLHEFGYEAPQRPPAWFARQERQQKVRDAVEEARIEVMQRRLWKYQFEPILAEIEDDAERVVVGEQLWAKVLVLAKRMVWDRRHGGAA